MKMSDVFDREVETEKTFPMGKGDLAKFRTLLLRDEEAEAACRAINSHDALVELNKELIKALESCILDMCISCEGQVNGTAVKADSALTKAKELLKEQGE